MAYRAINPYTGKLIREFPATTAKQVLGLS